MYSLFIAVLCSAAPVGRSPATLEKTSFASEEFVEGATDERLSIGGWPTLTFPSHGVVILWDMEVSRYTFTAKPSDSGYTIFLKDEWGHTRTAFWQWIGEGRANTDLWGYSRVATLSHSPWDRRSAFGSRLAAKMLPPGEFRDSRGPLFMLQRDGGVTWSRPEQQGVFSRCWLDCREGVQKYLCVRFERPEPEDPFAVDREYLFETRDGGVVGTPVREISMCGAREPVTGDVVTSYKK